MGYRVSLDQFAFFRQGRLEFVEQPRLAGSSLRYHRNYLTLAIDSQFERTTHLRQLVFTPDELGQAPLRGDVEVIVQRSNAEHFENFDRFPDSFDLG